ncbi:MAG: amidohydrolase family protein [Acidimicrobiales bacterium]
MPPPSRAPEAVVLTGATVVVALDPPEVVRADLIIEGARVRGFGPAPKGAIRRDCSGTIVVPGNVCAHHHLYSALARGMPYDLDTPKNFLEILQLIWWRLDRALDERSVRASATIGALEALRCGTTTIVDHHASPNFIDGSLDVIADALGSLGVRAICCYEVTDRDGPARAAAGLAENRRFLGAPRPLARGMVGAHASFTLSDDTLVACAELAHDARTGVHIHVAEDVCDEDDAETLFQMRVVERLSDAGVLDRRALLAHCVHVDEGEIARIDASGSTVVCNPRSNMNNGVGHSPFTYRGVNVALGTDGIGGDMVAESQVGYFRARDGGHDVAGSWPISRLAASARLAGDVYEEPLLGTLRPGSPADLCVLSYDPPAPLDAGNLSGHFVFGLSSGRVRDVYVAGERVVHDGHSTRVDETELAAKARVVTEELWNRLEQIPPHTFSPRVRTTS